jgi:NTE family protein
LSDHPAAVAALASPAKVGLALAGGGPEGAVYEIGALRALDEALGGIDFNHLDLYVGVSAGAFVGACLANDLTTAQMCRAILKPEPGEHPFVPETFLTPDFGELSRSALAVPGLIVGALWEAVRDWPEASLPMSILRLSRALPLGVFDNDPIRSYLERIYNLKGRTDDFRQLDKRLVVVATDLDTGQPVCFGTPGLDHVPISLAVAASSALPGLYRPVEIEGRHYVDGILHKTLHASVAIDAGADVVLCINPIVPLNGDRAAAAAPARFRNLRERGLPAIMSQSLRTLIRSRLQTGMASYRQKFPDRAVVLLEPPADDPVMFDTNIFGFADRRAVCEHAYLATRRYLRDHASTLAPLLGRHGIELRTEVLAEDRDLWEQVGLSAQVAAPPAPGDVMLRLERSLAGLERLLDADALELDGAVSIRS